MSMHLHALRQSLVVLALFGASGALADVRTQGLSPEDTERSVRQQLERLSYYGVFDYIVFRVDRGVVYLAGYSVEGRLKGDAEMAVKRASDGGDVENSLVAAASVGAAQHGRDATLGTLTRIGGAQ